MRTGYNDARRMLIELLKRPDDGPVDVSDLSDDEKGFLVATCAATVLLHQICFTASYDEKEAKAGIASLCIDTHINEICEGRAP